MDNGRVKGDARVTGLSDRQVDGVVHNNGERISGKGLGEKINTSVLAMFSLSHKLDIHKEMSEK